MRTRGPSLVLAAFVAALPAARASAQSERGAAPPRTAVQPTEWTWEREPQQVNDPSPRPELNVFADEQRPLRRTTSGLLGAESDHARPATGSAGWVRTLASLAGVVALIVLLTWGYRWTAGVGKGWSLAARGRQPGLIEVLSRAPLGAKHALLLVRVGPRLVLLGVGGDSLRTLDVIEDADLAARLAGQAARQRPDSHTAEFQRCLEREARGYEPEGAAADEPRLAALKRSLAETGRRALAVGQRT